MNWCPFSLVIALENNYIPITICNSKSFALRISTHCCYRIFIYHLKTYSFIERSSINFYIVNLSQIISYCYKFFPILILISSCGTSKKAYLSFLKLLLAFYKCQLSCSIVVPYLACFQKTHNEIILFFYFYIFDSKAFTSIFELQYL